MSHKKNSDLLPDCQPDASLDRFWHDSVAQSPGGRVSTFLAYLTYVAWYINQYEDGPSASWLEFKEWYHSRSIKWAGNTDDTKWFTDVQLVKPLPHILSEEETGSLCADLARTLTPETKTRYFSAER